MDFLLHISKIDNNNIKICNKWKDFITPRESVLYLRKRKSSDQIIQLETEVFNIILLGDCIVAPPFQANISNYITENFNSIPDFIRELEGHFYLIFINKRYKNAKVYNSLFSILPVYFIDSDNFIALSSGLNILKESYLKRINMTLNKRYILEKLLFNYPLFNATIVNEISLLPANSYLEILDNKYQIAKHTNISDYFVSEPLPWKKSVKSSTEFFLENLNKYFPEEKIMISLTGGFDGRSLVAATYNSKNEFATYSFGQSSSFDVSIPSEICKELGIEYNKILLDNDYSDNHFLESSQDLLKLTDGQANISRAHYIYAMKILEDNYNYILTGNFGSELFRAMHIRGVVTSSELIKIFSDKSDIEILQDFKKNKKLQFIQFDSFKHQFEELSETIVEYRKSFDRDLAKNKLFYKYIFEEVFRKYFGPEIIAESFYLTNRTPFLSFAFVKEILKTELAGIYNSFMEKNPVIRFKGQYFYAYLINANCPELSHILTGKGYKPIDLLTIFGKIRLLKSYLKKKRAKNYVADEYGVKRGLEKNYKNFMNFNINKDLFNEKYFDKSFIYKRWSHQQDIYINTLSLLMHDRHFFQNSDNYL